MFRHRWNAFTRRDINANLAAWQNWLDSGWGSRRKVIMGDRINEETALTIPTVLACTKIIAETVGTLPCTLYKPDGRGGRLVADTEDEYYLMHDAPNDNDTACDFHENYLTSLILNGNGYAWTPHNDRGRVIAVWPLPDRAVNIRVVKGVVTYQTYAITGNESILFNGYDMFHTKVFSRNGINGSSLVRMAAELFGQSLGQNEFSSAVYKNGATVSGIVSTDYEFNNQEDADSLKAQLREQYAGTENAGKMMYLPYNLKFQPITMTPEDMLMVEQMKLTIRQVAALFGVPSHMLQQIEKGTFNTVEQQGQEFIQLCLRKWCVRYEQSMNIRLLNKGQRQRGLHFKFDLDDLLRGDTAARAAFYTVMLAQGVFTRNEVRIAEGKNPLDGLDEPLSPMNYQSQADAAAGSGDNAAEEDAETAPAKGKKDKQKTGSDGAKTPQAKGKRGAVVAHQAAIEVSEEVLTEAIEQIFRTEQKFIERNRALPADEQKQHLQKSYAGHRKYAAQRLEKPLARMHRLNGLDMTDEKLDQASALVANWYGATAIQAKGEVIFSDVVNGAREAVLQLIGAE